MYRTELITKILQVTGQFGRVNPNVTSSLNKLIDRYEQNLRTMDNPDSEEGKRPERPDDDDKG